MTKNHQRPSVEDQIDRSFEHFLGDNKDLIIAFFVEFSRFEYALKRAGYIENNNRASADWDKFANNIQKKTQLSELKNKISEVNYLLENPPKKQICKDNKLGWVDAERDCDKSEIHWMLDLVKVVRNNLFHGGKFPYGPVKDPARDTKLLKGSLAVLDECLRLDKKVRSCFCEELE